MNKIELKLFSITSTVNVICIKKMVAKALFRKLFIIQMNSFIIYNN